MSRSIFFFIVLSLSTSAFAAKMDIDTHTLVIDKLENVIKESRKSPKHNISLMLRLADLYAERARLKTMKEVEQNCNSCLGSKTDRQMAIAKYKGITPYVEGEMGATVVMQTAHLYQLIDQNSEAKKLYNSIIRNRKKRSSRVVGQAYTGLAHLEFNANKYKSALKYYNLALKQKDAPQKGYLVYRKSWCLLNIGKTSQAIAEMKRVLTTESLLNISDGADLSANATFHQDVSRDFASFLVRKNLNVQDIEMLETVSPNSVVKENLFYLGTEAERVGQKNAALLVWSVYTARNDVPFEEKLEIQTRRAKIYYDLDQKKSALSAYKEALKLWTTRHCSDSVDCAGIQLRLRNFPITWNKLEKKKPTKSIHQAYRAYLEVFKDDFEMHYWAAQVARNLKDYQSSVTDYRRASVTAKPQRNSSNKTKSQAAQKIYTGALLAEIEMAELSGHPVARESAYKNYLNEVPRGEKSDLIRYQLAHLAYEQKQYQKAAYQFQTLAENKGVAAKTRIQAADLSLDSLAVLKDHGRLEAWGLAYAQDLPQRKNEYLKISGKASLNLIALIVNSDRSSESDLRGAQNKIKSISIAQLGKDETEAYWKNRLLLAEKLKDLNEIKLAGGQYLKIKSVSNIQKNWAQSLLVFAHEMLFEFRSAYEIAQTTRFPKINKTDTYLKLAMLADLSGKDSDAKSYYEKFIKATRSVRKANIVRAKLVRQSRDPWSTLLDYLPRLRRTPDVLAAVTLETFGRYSNYQKAEKVFNNQKKIAKYPEGKTLQKFLFLKDYWQFDKQLRSHRISQSSQSRLQKTLQKRIQLLSQSENWVTKAARTGDWTLQVITLSRLAEEYKDLHSTILKLRMPKGLNKQQRQEYRTLIAQQAEPYSKKHQAFASKTDEFWNNSNALESLNSDFQNADPAVRRLIKDELNALKMRAPRSTQSSIERILTQSLPTPSRNQINAAYERVKQQPFSRSELEDLIKIEEQRAQNPTMIAYLEDRKQALKEVQ